MLYRYYRNGLLVLSHHPVDFEIDEKFANNRHTIVIKSKKDNIVLDNVSDTMPIHDVAKKEAFFNGYQSWTDSKEIKLKAKEKNIYRSPQAVVRAFAMDKYGDAPFYKYRRHVIHGYDVCYSKSGEGFFHFNLNYRNAYLLFEYNKRNHRLTITSDLNGIKLNKGDEMTVWDCAYYESYEEGYEAFNKYFPKKNIKKMFGYTSWYNYYQNINDKIILRDLEAIDNRFNLFQIDDGYEAFVGDWFDIDPKKFPDGLKPIVEKIHSKGLSAGIWLAPFVAEEKSKLFLEHPEYIKKDKKGMLVKAGGNWSGQYALDLEKEEVREYIRKFLKYYMDLGFDFFKLDFLYAAGIEVPEGYSRCQYQDKAYKFLRECLPGKIILGCGANLVNSIDYFDYLRIGPDVSLKWDDVAYMRLFHRERPSTKTTLQNTIFRSFLNDRWFGNDPDVFLLRDNNIDMNDDQKKSLALINSLFSSVLMTSDDIGVYDKDKNEHLEAVLDNFLHAKNARFVKKDGKIQLFYELNNKQYHYYYDYKNGVLTNGQE